MTRSRYSLLVAIALVAVLVMPVRGQEAQKYEKTQPDYYLEKSKKALVVSNDGAISYKDQVLSLNEFNTLMSILEGKLKQLNAVLSNITSKDFFGTKYATGEYWKVPLQEAKGNIERALYFMNKIQSNPNSIQYSFFVYENIQSALHSTDLVSQYRKNPPPAMIRDESGKKLSDAWIGTSDWSSVFLTAHLLPLLVAKDENKQLYREE
jgi:hypothetical protein